MLGGHIFTIGYGARSFSDVLGQIQPAGVEFVVDVRSAPFSRYQPEFSRPALDRLLRENGIKYVFMGDQLGGRPPDVDCYTNGKVDYAKCEAKDFFQAGIRRLLDACSQGFHVCILCSESNPEQCHRSKLIARSLEARDVEVMHLLPDGSVRSTGEVIHKLTGGQETLFGDHFVSRRTYRQK